MVEDDSSAEDTAFIPSQGSSTGSSCVMVHSPVQVRAQRSSSSQQGSGLPGVRPDDCKLYMDWSKMSLVKLRSNGVQEVARMQPGPHGFQMASFADGTSVETEVANELPVPELPVIQKKPAAARTLKRPAASASLAAEQDGSAVEEDASDEADEPEPGQQPDQGQEHGIELLKSFSGKTHPQLGNLSGGCYTGQSYICHTNAEGKKVLLISVPKGSTEFHHAVCNDLSRYMMTQTVVTKESLTIKRAECIALRSQPQVH